jgi:CRP-like cAMP-binding protein
MAVAGYGWQSFLESLEERDRATLLELGHRRNWRRGEALFYADDRADSAIIITGGLVKIHKITAAGAEVVLGLSGPGDMLGEISAVSEALRSASATALQPAEGFAIAVPELRAFLAQHPRATLGLLAMTIRRLYSADERRLEFATAESLARVASRLVELAERFGQRFEGGVVEVALPITQEELASWSASSRESTARSLRTLRELGVIETKRMRLTVLDLNGLKLHSARL